MKNLILIAVLLVIAGLGLWAWRGDSREPLPVTGELATYTDPEGVFRFRYPEAFSVSGRDGSVVARVNVPKSYMPGTNFSEAEMTINWSSGATDETCKGTTVENGAAAGNRYETTTTKKIYDGDCYSFVYVIHSANIGNYDPSMNIEEFDRDSLQDDMEDIIDSFEYLVSSD